MPFDVRFKVNRTPRERMHESLKIVNAGFGGIRWNKIIFPSFEHVQVKTLRVSQQNLKFFNPLIEQNAEQKMAVIETFGGFVKQVEFKKQITVRIRNLYRKDTEPLYNSFMYSFVSLPSGIYPLPPMHSLLVTLYVMEYLISINQRLSKCQPYPCKNEKYRKKNVLDEAMSGFQIAFENRLTYG